jgi:hypothetical protein
MRSAWPAPTRWRRRSASEARHSPLGNEIYLFGYVFKYAIDLPAGATAIVLPPNDRIRIFAMTAANEPAPPVRPASVFYAPELGAAGGRQ